MDNVKMVKSRKIIAWTAAVLIVLPFVLWCLCPVPTFGYADKLYDMSPQPLELIEGGDLFEISYCGMTGEVAAFIVVSRSDSIGYTFTDAEWTEGEMTGKHYHGGSISEKRPSGWTEPDEFGQLIGGNPRAQDHYIPPRSEGTGYAFACQTIPKYSGQIRVTLYFRECVRSEETGEISSVGERLSATFEMDMPKPSRSRFDVTAVDFVWLHSCELYIRNNTEEDIELWFDKESFLLEQKERNGGYTEVMRGYHDTYYDYISESEPRYMRSSEGRGKFYHCQLNLPDSVGPGDYRLTLGFNTEKDGSGDCYTLTLNLRLHEQGSLLRG